MILDLIHAVGVSLLPLPVAALLLVVGTALLWLARSGRVRRRLRGGAGDAPHGGPLSDEGPATHERPDAGEDPATDQRPDPDGGAEADGVEPRVGGSRFGRLGRAGLLLVTAGTLLLVVASTAPVTHTALGSLEDDFPPYRPDARGASTSTASGQGGEAADADGMVSAAPRWIVVLCGGGSGLSGWPDLAGLSTHTLVRVVEGIRIAGIHPGARLLFTGGAPPGERACSDVMRGAALELGVDPTRISVETGSRSTAGEAAAVQARVGGEPFVLVTAASHMPRAVALMRARGLDPLPAPAGPRALGGGSTLLGAVRPDAETLLGSHLWTHEVLGMVWAEMRGTL